MRLFFNRVLSTLVRAHPAWLCAGVVLAALAFRVAVAARHHSEAICVSMMMKGVPFSDAANWHTLASDFSEGKRWFAGWEWWGGRRPFYYMFMGSVFAWTGPSVWTARVVHILLSVVAAGLIFDLCRRTFGVFIASLAGFFAALDFHDARVDLETMTEPLGSFLIVVSLWCFVSGMQRAGDMAKPHQKFGPAALLFLSGAFLALGNLTRPLTLPAGLALVVLVLLPLRRAGDPSRLRRPILRLVVAYALGVVLLLAPWLARQYRAYGVVTLSDNAVESVYAASSPKYGTWSAEIPFLASHCPTVKERIEFFSAGVRYNLRHHLAFYAGNAWTHVKAAGRKLCPPAWLVTVMFAAFAARRLAASPPSRYLLRAACGWVALAAGAHYWPATTAVVYGAAGLALAVYRRHAALIFAVFLSITVMTIASMAQSDDRLCLPLRWMALAPAAWCLMSVFDLIERGSRAACLSDGAFLVDIPPWGRFGKALATVAAAGCLVLTLGFVKAARAQYVSRAPCRLGWVEGDEARHWVDTVFARKELAPYLPFRDRVRVARQRVTGGIIIRVSGGENIYHPWSALFVPRPYDYTVFQAYPTAVWALFPGPVSPAFEGRDLILVGIPVVRDVFTLHTLAIIRPNDPTGPADVLTAPEPVARQYAGEIRPPVELSP